jgi:hypothetical protein
MQWERRRGDEAPGEVIVVSGVAESADLGASDDGEKIEVVEGAGRLGELTRWQGICRAMPV